MNCNPDPYIVFAIIVFLGILSFSCQVMLR